MWEYHSEGMIYDDADHTYTLEGRKLSGVTTMLQNCGIINNRFYTEAGAENGKRRHYLCELYDKDNLNWETIGEADYPYLEGWTKAREEMKIEIQGIEVGAYHPLLFYAGRVDRLVLIDGKPYIIDIKTGAINKATELQLILYGMMFTYNGERAGLKTIYLQKNGKYKPREARYEDERFAMSAIRVEQWKNR